MEILTTRLRLVPIGLKNADDLQRIHRDPAVIEWYGEMSDEQIITRAGSFGEQWRTRGVSKWLAYEKVSNDHVGRRGLSRVPVEGREQLEESAGFYSATTGDAVTPPRSAEPASTSRPIASTRTR